MQRIIQSFIQVKNNVINYILHKHVSEHRNILRYNIVYINFVSVVLVEIKLNLINKENVFYAIMPLPCLPIILDMYIIHMERSQGRFFS